MWTNEKAAGLLPWIFQADDPRDPIQQANDRYAHGGGWSDKWTLMSIERGDWSFVDLDRPGLARLEYLDAEMREYDDAPEIMHECSRTRIRDWLIVLFETGLVVLRRDGEPPRLDRMD